MDLSNIKVQSPGKDLHCCLSRTQTIARSFSTFSCPFPAFSGGDPSFKFQPPGICTGQHVKVYPSTHKPGSCLSSYRHPQTKPVNAQLQVKTRWFYGHNVGRAISFICFAQGSTTLDFSSFTDFLLHTGTSLLCSPLWWASTVKVHVCLSSTSFTTQGRCTQCTHAPVPQGKKTT